MKIRQEIYDTYWKFAALRQDIFFARINGAKQPWTNDRILNTYKFCNSYRASDRVSQYLIKNVIYNRKMNEEDILFRIILFKIFNKIETWELLSSKIGEISLSNFDYNTFDTIFNDAIDNEQSIYTNAYIICANKAFGYDTKHRNHLALLMHMFKNNILIRKVTKARNLEDLYMILLDYPLIGKFTSYQFSIDINYSEIVNFSENDFTVAGPGAERGIRKCFLDTGDKSFPYIIRYMRDKQEYEFEKLGIKFKNLWGRPLHDIDCQNLFCETDKYCRIAFPEVSSNRSKIKNKFTPNTNKISYFYPPKWKLSL